MITTITLNAAIDKYYHVHRFGLNKVHRVTEVIEVPGGKGINVAKVAHTLGAKVAASGFVGGSNGQFIHQNVEKLGIESDFVWVAGNSRQNLAIIDEAQGTQTELLEPGPVIEENAQKQLVEKIRGLSKKSKVVSFSGSVPRGLPHDIYARLVQAAKDQGAITILDTSGEWLSLGLEGKPDICKPNRDELEQLLGCRCSSQSEIVAAARTILDKGIQLVVVSMDKDGAIAVMKDAAWHIKPPEIRVQSTVGCGDSLVGGMAFYLDQLEGDPSPFDFVEALKWGTAAAASNALHKAAGSITRQEVNRFLDRISINRLA